jgi:DNA-binding transcriptional ArsR family regulator
MTVSSSSLEAIMRHDGRLDVLCCLLDDEALTVPQLSARTGRSMAVVAHHLRLLDSFELVEKADEPDRVDPMYAATLDGHPDWVQEAVEEHRRID